MPDIEYFCSLLHLQNIICYIMYKNSDFNIWLWCLASLRKLEEQPEWLKGGKLRDYQLEGLNFLVNRYACLYMVVKFCF